jgi:Ca2+-binding RTX toxin-like protein
VPGTAKAENGVLAIRGTEEAETITVSQELNTPDPSSAGPGAVARFNYSIRQGDRVIDSGSIESDGSITRISIHAGGGDDLVDAAGRTFDLTGGMSPVSVPVTILGGDGNDRIYGGEGEDQLNGGGGNDQLDGGGGNDFVGRVLEEEPGNDTLAGGPGDDVLDGGDGEDRASGGDGDDSVRGGGRVVGGDGADEVRGDGGFDTFWASDAPAERLDRGDEDRVKDDLWLGPPLGAGQPGATVENGVLVIRGTQAADTIRVSQTLRSPGNNAADDPGVVARFNYTIREGDRMIASGSIEAGGKISQIAISPLGGDDVVDVAGRTFDLPAGASPVTVPVTVFGDDGNDEIYGGAGRDRLNGGDGDDRIDGGGGDDLIGSSIVEPGYPYGLVGGTAHLPETGNNTLVGGAGNDEVNGGGGDDRIFGGDGHDRVNGGGGADEIRGEAGRDRFSLSDDPAEQLDRDAEDAAVG